MKKLLVPKNIKYAIFLLFILSRLGNLGHDIFNTDVWKWKTRSYDFGSGVFGLDFKKTDQKYHPGVTLMWIGSVGIKVFNLYTDVVYPGQDASSLGVIHTFGLHFVQKFLVVLVISVTLASIYFVLEKLFGKNYALITIFLISVEPFYVALTRVFHLEGLLSTFMLACVIWLYLYLAEKKNKYLVISAIYGGLSLLTKTSSIYLLPFVGLGTFTYLKYSEDSIKTSFLSSVKTFLPWLGISFITFFVLWPALWVDFTNVIGNLYRGITSIGVEGDHYQIYFGNLVDNPGVTYYPVVFLLRSSPYMIVGLVGLFISRKSINLKKYGAFPLYMFFYSLFYIVQHTLPTKKLDRYILPALVGVIPIISIYFTYVLEKIAVKRKLILTIFVIFPVLILCRLHSDYLSYFNPLFGGLRVGASVLEPKWLIGKDEIVKYFIKVRDTEDYDVAPVCSSFECVIEEDYMDQTLSVGFPEKYATQIYPFINEIGGWAIIKDLTPFAKHTNYFVYPVWQDDSYLEDRFDIEYVDSIYVRKVPLYNVYKRNQE